MLGSLLEEKGGDLHVTETHWPHLEVRFDKFNIIVYVDGLDVVQSPLGERLLSLAVRQPREVIRAHLEGVWQCQAVIDGYQLKEAFSRELVLDLSDENVTFVAVKIQDPKVQDCNFMNFVSRKKIAGIIFDRALVLDEFLERAHFTLGCLNQVEGGLTLGVPGRV